MNDWPNLWTIQDGFPPEFLQFDYDHFVRGSHVRRVWHMHDIDMDEWRFDTLGDDSETYEVIHEKFRENFLNALGIVRTGKKS